MLLVKTATFGTMLHTKTSHDSLQISFPVVVKTIPVYPGVPCRNTTSIHQSPYLTRAYLPKMYCNLSDLSKNAIKLWKFYGMHTHVRYSHTGLRAFCIFQDLNLGENRLINSTTVTNSESVVFKWYDFPFTSSKYGYKQSTHGVCCKLGQSL